MMSGQSPPRPVCDPAVLKQRLDRLGITGAESNVMGGRIVFDLVRPSTYDSCMFGYLFLLFTIVPLVELALLVRIGQETEWWVPLLMVVVSGFAGALLARWQGWRALTRIREELRAGRLPTEALVDGVMILVAGLFLITPGVLTDLLGIALLIPPVRRVVQHSVVAWLRRNVEVRTASFTGGASAPGTANSAGEWNASYTRIPETPGRAEIIDARVIGTRVEDA
jgi:UPF0716 protein FxsA